MSMLSFATAAVAVARPPAFSAPVDYAPVAPVVEAGVPWPALQTTASASIVIGDTVRPASPYVFGTNFPVYWGRKYSRTDEMRAQLRAATSFVRWPGGTPANEYIWDGNWSAHPYFQKWEGQYGSDYIQTADELILTCKAIGAEPLVQMNAAQALIEGVDAAVDMSLRLLRKLIGSGLTVNYVSFGNEDYGPWEPPYGDVPVDGEVYGKAFSQWVDGMRQEFPDIYYGVVGLWTPNDGIHDPMRATAREPLLKGGAKVGVIANWMGDMLSKTNAIAKADWLVLHDYFYKDATPISTPDLLAKASDLYKMPKGVADFISQFSPQTPMPALALTEFNIASAYSQGGNATARMAGALFLAELMGETLTSAPVAALTEFAWHAKWYENTDRSGSYGDYTFGGPTWAPNVTANTLLPKFYSMALLKLVTGQLVLSATSTNAAVKSYASQFDHGEVGIVLLNEGLEATKVSLAGLSGAGRLNSFAKGATVNGWVLEGDASSLVPEVGGTSLLDAPAVLLNGVGNGQKLGGPWPIDTIKPYTVTAAAGADFEVEIPPASIVALMVYGARSSFPSPPPSPPFPPPPPPPPCYTASYDACLDRRCCQDAGFGCYKRPTLQYAQCRPLQDNCVDDDEWLCPGWWL